MKRFMQLFLAGTLLMATAFCQTQVRDLDNGARHAYQGTLYSPQGLTGLYNMSLPAPPAGQRLVIEYMAVHANLPAGQEAFCTTVNTGPASPGFNAPVISLPPSGTFFAGMKVYGGPMRLYVDGPAIFAVSCTKENPIGTYSFHVTVVGYTVELNPLATM